MTETNADKPSPEDAPRAAAADTQRLKGEADARDEAAAQDQTENPDEAAAREESPDETEMQDETKAQSKDAAQEEEAQSGVAAQEEEEPALEEKSGGLAAKALMLLVALLVGAGGALYAAPKIAPIAPAWLAPYLTPADDAVAIRLDALETRIDEKFTALDAADAGQTGRMNDETARIGKQMDVLSAALDPVGGFDDQIAALTARLDALNAKFSSAPAPAADATGVTATSGPNPQTGAKIAALEAAIAELRDEIATRDSASDLAPELESRVATIESQMKNAFEVGKGTATGIAFADLARAVAGAAPFTAELDAVVKLTGHAAPDPLSAAAQAGLPAMATLNATFSPAAHGEILCLARAGAGESMTAQVEAWLRSLVLVRPVDETDGRAPPAVLRRAQARLGEGDLAAALIELRALPSDECKAMAEWIDAAGQRAETEAALAKYRATILGVE